MSERGIPLERKDVKGSRAASASASSSRSTVNVSRSGGGSRSRGGGGSARKSGGSSKKSAADLLCEKLYDAVYNAETSDGRWLADIFVALPTPAELPEYVTNSLHPLRFLLIREH